MERKNIEIDNLIVDTAQSRKGEWAGDEQDQRLVNSLERDGLMQSLLVRPVENTGYGENVEEEYAIVAGSRRYHAAMEAGFETIHCKVIDADDFEAAKKSLKENEERKGLSDQEVARSLKMQFEMLKPNGKVECPDCGDSFEDLNRHSNQANCETVTKPEGNESGSGSLTFLTESAVYGYLATEHFGDDGKTQVKKVKQLISIAELPEEIQAMWKPPEERTEEEEETLKKFDIERDLTAERGGDVSRLGNEVLSLHRTVDENTDSDAINTTNAVLETMGRLDFDQNPTDMEQDIQTFRSEISEIGDIESAEEQEREFRTRLENHQQQIREMNEELEDETAVGQVNLTFKDQRYKRYHARAKQQMGVSSNTEVVREAYRDYLEEQADKNGW